MKISHKLNVDHIVIYTVTRVRTRLGEQVGGKDGYNGVKCSRNMGAVFLTSDS